MAPEADPSPPPLRQRFANIPVRLLATLFVLLLVLGGAIALVVVARRPKPTPTLATLPPDDPRLLYSGPYQNIHPDVPYVGDRACAGCHQDQDTPFHRHAMGRSLLPIARVAAEQVYDSAHQNTFDALGSRFLVERQGDQVRHRRTVLGEKGEPVGALDFPVDYVIGSGTHGHSYLTNRDGYLFETPISWFSQKKRWDKSPGFEVEMLAGRPVPASCLFCHANHVRPREGYANRYETPLFDGHAIGCERCHGPGERHVQDPGNRDPQTKIDYTIVNPRHLQPELRAAICEQCHLEGEGRTVRRHRDLFDYRPGLPMQPFWSIFVRAPTAEEDYKAVNHVEQMYESRCFQRSADDPRAGMRKLGCTSCHDPHVPDSGGEFVTHYRQACLKCHEAGGCSVPELERRQTSKQDSCIECHMAPYGASDIAHTASTDHRILRRPGAMVRKDAARPGSGLPIVPFYSDQRDSEDKDLQRDLALALVQHPGKGKAESARVLRHAVGMLETALRDDAGDVEALEAKAHALTLLNDQQQALAALETALEQAPQRETTLVAAATLAQNAQKNDQALAYWRRAVDLNPWMPAYRRSLALLLEQKQAWDELRPQCETWLRLDPSSVDARRLWVACLLKDGKRDEARAEFAKIELLNPPNLPELKAWFTVKSRPR